MNDRDIGQEVLDGIQSIKAGKGRRYTVRIPQDVKAIRERMKLSQAEFSSRLGVSVRTLQEWEQGRRNPSGPAVSLLGIAPNTKPPEKKPIALRAIPWSTPWPRRIGGKKWHHHH